MVEKWHNLTMCKKCLAAKFGWKYQKVRVEVYLMSELYPKQIARDNYDITHNPNVKVKYPTLYKEVVEHDKVSTSSWYDLSFGAYSEFQEYIQDKNIGYVS